MSNLTQTSPAIFPLENGDRITRQEFERRYDAMPHLKKAELIKGVVYVASALRYRRHGRPHSLMMGWLIAYEMATPGVESADNATIRLDAENDPQPDALLRITTESGGQSWISDDDYIEGAPELVIEIASSTASYDLHDKLDAYCRNGVKEYLVWRVLEQQFDWFQLQGGVFIRQQPDASGILYSGIFSGLNLKVTALLSGNLAEVVAEVQRGIATEAHREFVQRLRR